MGGFAGAVSCAFLGSLMPQHQSSCRPQTAIDDSRSFKSTGQAYRFLSAHDQVNNVFHLRRDRITAAEHRASKTQKFQIRAEICSIGLMEFSDAFCQSAKPG
jgi:hypothetical protein